MSEDTTRQRVRITYEKGERVKFISHMDEFRLWERTVRRADLPLLYKRGFNPQPHIQFASPLGVGFTGSLETMDITFEPSLPLAELEHRIRTKLPPGITLRDLAEVPLKSPSLQSLLIGADYTIHIYAEPDEIPAGLLQGRVAAFLAGRQWLRRRQRKGRLYAYNLRPLVLELIYQGYESAAAEHRIFLRVQQQAGATGRPDEVVDVLGCDEYARTLNRDRLYYRHCPGDVEIFAQYPVVRQEEITHSLASLPQNEDAPSADEVRPLPEGGHFMGERAGDEFA